MEVHDVPPAARRSVARPGQGPRPLRGRPIEDGPGPQHDEGDGQLAGRPGGVPRPQPGRWPAARSTPEVRERISIEAAEANDCNYCLAAHTLLGKLAGLDESERHAARRGESSDPKADAALKFARTLLENRGDVTDDDVRRVKEAGYTDGEVAEVIALVALNVLTNYFNVAAGTPIDFPAVGPLESASA